METRVDQKLTMVGRVRARYQDHDVSVREKAVSLFVLNAILCVGFLVLGGVRLAEGAIVTGAAEVVISVLLGLSVFGILRGAFKAVSVATVVLFVVASAGLFAIRDITSPNDIYIQTTYMIPVFATATLLAYATWQVMMILGAGSVVIVLQYALRVAPTLDALGHGSGMSEFLVALLLTIFTAIFTWQTFKMQHRTLDLIQRQAAVSDERLVRMKQLVDRLGAAFNVGAELQEGAEHNAHAAQQLTDNVTAIAEELESLRATLQTTTDAHARIESVKTDVESVTGNQTEVIDANTQTIGRLSEDVVSMRDSTRTRSNVIQELVNSAQRAEASLAKTLASFKDIEQSSEKILGVNSVIQQIAARTNLLAMNAAIEAAHAGDAGRGFAVVAEEIRKLADETDQNSRIIRETLKANQELNARLLDDGQSLSSVFAAISTSVEDVHAFLASIIDSMGSLASGHEAVREQTARLDGVNHDVQRAVHAMTESLRAETEGLDRVSESVGRIDDVLRRLRTVAEENLGISSRLEEIGTENVRSFATLDEAMDHLRDVTGRGDDQVVRTIREATGARQA